MTSMEPVKDSSPNGLSANITLQFDIASFPVG